MNDNAFQAVCGFHMGYLTDEVDLIRHSMTDVLKMYQDGKIKPRIDSTWAVEDVSPTVVVGHSPSCFVLQVM